MKEFVRKTKPENCIEDAQAMKMREHWNATRAQAIEQAEVRDIVKLKS